ncbi:MAG: FAD-dependent thymidylate synthase [Legionella sp.]|uniref:FAD-dependent thymidylate synthase n=1 Tax=Legionella sp. TaxID=459 RepID=UPI00284EEEC5|nr:FAD-dependent thymidylate synthase [Legionella sp.]
MTKIAAELIDHMGGDLSVVRAAKVSFADDQKVQKFIDAIEAKELGCKSHTGLIKYLSKHNHWTPFAHTAITLRVSAPVPIRTQCFKHKQGFVENEESRRYIKSRPELYIPEHFRIAPEEGKEKQGSYGVHNDSTSWLLEYMNICYEAIRLYERMVEDEVCPEQARFVLPQGCIVNWYWTGSLAAFARFYKQRTDPHAQEEVRNLAKDIGKIIAPLYPVSWKELTNG